MLCATYHVDLCTDTVAIYLYATKTMGIPIFKTSKENENWFGKSRVKLQRSTKGWETSELSLELTERRMQQAFKRLAYSMLLYFDFSRNAREKGLVKHQPINHQLRTWRRERLTRNHWKQILPNDRKSTGQLTWKLRKDCVSSRATLTKTKVFTNRSFFQHLELLPPVRSWKQLRLAQQTDLAIGFLG